MTTSNIVVLFLVSADAVELDIRMIETGLQYMQELKASGRAERSGCSQQSRNCESSDLCIMMGRAAGCTLAQAWLLLALASADCRGISHCRILDHRTQGCPVCCCKEASLPL